MRGVQGREVNTVTLVVAPCSGVFTQEGRRRVRADLRRGLGAGVGGESGGEGLDQTVIWTGGGRRIQTA